MTTITLKYTDAESVLAAVGVLAKRGEEAVQLVRDLVPSAVEIVLRTGKVQAANAVVNAARLSGHAPAVIAAFRSAIPYKANKAGDFGGRADKAKAKRLKAETEAGVYYGTEKAHKAINEALTRLTEAKVKAAETRSSKSEGQKFAEKLLNLAGKATGIGMSEAEFLEAARDAYRAAAK